jgi:hypothetical protein
METSTCKQANKELRNLYSLPNISVTMSKRMKWAEYIERRWEIRSAFKI